MTTPSETFLTVREQLIHTRTIRGSGLPRLLTYREAWDVVASAGVERALFADPLDQATLSRLVVALERKAVQALEREGKLLVACWYCDGTGRDVVVDEPTEPCPRCRGRGTGNAEAVIRSVVWMSRSPALDPDKFLAEQAREFERALGLQPGSVQPATDESGREVFRLKVPGALYSFAIPVRCSALEPKEKK